MEKLKTLAELEKETIQAYLRINMYNKTRTAAALGITIKTLYNKIHEYGWDLFTLKERSRTYDPPYAESVSI